MTTAKFVYDILKSMKIGIDARLWNESGVGRYIRNLVWQLQKLDKKNEYVLFVSNKDTEEILRYAQNDKFRVVKADIRWHTIEEQVRFPSIIYKENLDWMPFPYFSVPIFYNKPFVVTIHDLILHSFPTGQASTLPLPMYYAKLFGYKFVISRAARKAVKIIAVSKATKNEIVTQLGVDENKVVVTYEGVDLNLSSKLKTKSSKQKLIAQNYFLYVGNAYPHKNLEKLIESFVKFSVKYPDVCLVLVGKEDFFYKRLKEKVKKIGLLERVIFFGYATEEELALLYKDAVALVMPSLMEGFGLPALEAMANGCLILASKIPALQEICGDVAIYFNPLSSQDLYKKMEDIFSNDSNHRSRKIAMGLEKAKQFSWEKMAKETLNVYESCISV